MDEAAWLRRRNVMGIVRLLGVDPVRLSSEASECEGRLVSRAALGVGRSPVVGPALCVEIVDHAGAGRSPADRTRVQGQRSVAWGQRTS